MADPDSPILAPVKRIVPAAALAALALLALAPSAAADPSVCLGYDPEGGRVSPGVDTNGGLMVYAGFYGVEENPDFPLPVGWGTYQVGYTDSDC